MLASDAHLSATIATLHGWGLLDTLISGVDGADTRPVMLQLLAGRAGEAMIAVLNPIVQRHCNTAQQSVFRIGAELRASLARMGLISSISRTAISSNSSVSSSSNAPFTGSGATGISPAARVVPVWDQWQLLRGNEATVGRYSDPIPGSLPEYLAHLTPQQRKQQAELLLRRAITSLVPFVYSQPLPSRADVIRIAGRAHNLEPSLIAALLLAEQRDQSSNEDAKDFTAAVSIKRANTSIGLGQVVISTATRNDLFADLLSASTRRALNYKQVAMLLSSDEFNIFCVARYARMVATQGSRQSIAKLPKTKAKFPGISLAAYAKSSSAWPDDNIKALGSEYTSRAWDDKLSPGWGDFVFEAYIDTKRSGAL